MKDWRLYVAFVAAVGFALVAGLTYVTVALVGAAAVAGLLVLTRLEPRPDPEFDRPQFDRRHGARGELQELAWAMVGRDGRASDRMLRRVREVASTRLERHGLDLTDPADEASIQELVGSKVFRTLTRTRSPRPKMSEVRQAVDALERIGTTRKSGDT